ncbi:hypothetical protein DKZ23_10465, partial [Limosilactobacillus reuteri]
MARAQGYTRVLKNIDPEVAGSNPALDILGNSSMAETMGCTRKTGPLMAVRFRPSALSAMTLNYIY